MIHGIKVEMIIFRKKKSRIKSHWKFEGKMLLKFSQVEVYLAYFQLDTIG